MEHKKRKKKTNIRGEHKKKRQEQGEQKEGESGLSTDAPAASMPISHISESSSRTTTRCPAHSASPSLAYDVLRIDIFNAFFLPCNKASTCFPIWQEMTCCLLACRSLTFTQPVTLCTKKAMLEETAYNRDSCWHLDLQDSSRR